MGVFFTNKNFFFLDYDELVCCLELLKILLLGVIVILRLLKINIVEFNTVGLVGEHHGVNRRLEQCGDMVDCQTRSFDLDVVLLC